MAKVIYVDWGNGDIEDLDCKTIKEAKKFCKDNHPETPVRFFSKEE